MIRLAIADPNEDIRDCLAAVLEREPDFRVVASLGRGSDLVDQARKGNVDIAIVAADPRGIDVASVCQHLRRTDPAIRTLATLPRPREAAMLSAFAAGVRGVVMTDAQPALLRTAVRTVVAGWTFVDPRLTAGLVRFALDGQRASGPGGLTLQELRVVERIPLGLSDLEIAEQLGLREATVRDHVRRIRTKLNARDRDDLALIARREGLS